MAAIGRMLHAWVPSQSTFVQMVGSLCVAVAVVIITSTVYTYFSVVLPLLIKPEGGQFGVTVVLCTWLSFNLMFNYCMVLTTKPGHAVEEMMRDVDLDMAEVHRKEKTPHGLWCHKCNKPRPFRAHHCPICGHCVLKMDHHCPWINQCVGHYNHRYFVLFLLYLLLSVAYATVTITLNYFGVLANPLSDLNQSSSVRLSMNVCFIVCLSLTLAMSGFFGWSAYLALSNKTTIEHVAASGRGNPYDHGWYPNLQVVFGSNKRLWQMLLPSIAPVDHDGHFYNCKPVADYAPAKPCCAQDKRCEGTRQSGTACGEAV